MPRDKSIKRVLIIGSGPIAIGQAAEFDYAGTQACRALKAEGIYTILVNSNPATIMTDKEMASRVYLEPLRVEVLKNIIRKERPDSILPTLGGQTGLNLACELAESGFLDEMGVRLLGTTVESIKKSEDRELFKQTMEEIGEPCIDSVIAHTVEDAVAFAASNGYPVIVRPAYTLGGTGGGIAENEGELRVICKTGLAASRVHQCLIEKCISGWKEIEYEVMRDESGNVITICNMENLDPVGIHTGDSIVLAPSQTLRDEEYQMLRSAALNIISALKICGGCNVQFALEPNSMRYAVIEVNPRVSRSSALASKATGYPIAKVAALIAVGYNLDEIVNGVTGKTYACFEPTLDYVVCKFPRWPFDKFTEANKTLGTRMKATGEVMAIGANFEAALLKAVRSLELGFNSLDYAKYSAMNKDQLFAALTVKNDERLFCVAAALRKGISVETVSEITTIDRWFLEKIKHIVLTEEKVKSFRGRAADITAEFMRELKYYGFSDRAVAGFTGSDEKSIRALRLGYGITPTYKMVDTCGAEFEAVSPYYYSTYEEENESVPSDRKKLVVLGSGPIRIGQGIEFDYCSVQCIKAIKAAGYEAIIINNNPETVSTDFDVSDRLYFEPLTPEDVIGVLDLEKPDGVIVQFGGQTAIKLAAAVSGAGYKILGTTPEAINDAEDREEFDKLLGRLNIMRPSGKTVFTREEALDAAHELGYPVLVRPSYVLGGQGMEIAYTDTEIREYMDIINVNIQEHPILVDKYVAGKELEVDAICDGKDVLIPGIMEHIERTGVHSGDSISRYPSSFLGDTVEHLVEITKKLALGTHTVGLINIQFILKGEDIYIIEVNPRSSRTVPYISKVTGIPMVALATRCCLGEPLAAMGYGTGLYKKSAYYAVKVPVFSNDKLPELEISLSPEMKSTGEVLGVAPTVGEAILKGLYASGINMGRGGIFISVNNKSKQEMLPLAKDLFALGYKIYATTGTAAVLRENGISAEEVGKLHECDDIAKMIRSGEIKLIVNTPTKGRNTRRDGFRIRRLAVESGINVFTSVDTVSAFVEALKVGKSDSELTPVALQDITL